MATFYVGPRPVLRGRDADEFVNAYTGEVGVYSNWSLFGPGLLTGAPDNDHTPGDGYHPHGIFLSRRFLGLDTVNALDAPGLGTRLDGFRWHPLENKAAGNALAFPSGYGHAYGIHVYGMDHFTQANRTVELNGGHAVRGVDAAGTANSFGSFGPDIYHGIPEGALADGGQALPTDPDNNYGHNRVNEWRGVTSSQAL